MAGVVVLLLGSCGRPPAVDEVSEPVVEATPTPEPTPTPVPYLLRKPLPTAELFNGLSLEAAVVAEPGEETAAQDRGDDDAYRVQVTLRARLPRPAVSLDDLAANDPELPGVFRDLPALLEGARVSPFFGKFYELKTNDLRRRLGRLDRVLSRHNFYDCDTMLELENPATGRKAFLLMADMDVNVDGSDGDRNFEVDGSGMFFLPQTSYRWRKLTERVNPFLPAEEEKLKRLREELAGGGVEAGRKREIDAGIDLAKRRIHDLRRWSFLISGADPFIVLPGFIMRDHEGPHVPEIGDYAVVIHGGRAYPAILGDSGPSHKAGEASVLICDEINERSSSWSRAESDLNATYLVFPGSRDEEAGPPDLARWRSRCQELVDELGGLTVELHEWPELVKPWPTPTPTPSPTPTPGPTPGVEAGVRESTGN